MTNRDNVPRMKSKNSLGWYARSLQCQPRLSLPKYGQTNITPRRLLSREFVDGKRKQHFAYITGFFFCSPPDLANIIESEDAAVEVRFPIETHTQNQERMHLHLFYSFVRSEKTDKSITARYGEPKYSVICMGPSWELARFPEYACSDYLFSY